MSLLRTRARFRILGLLVPTALAFLLGGCVNGTAKEAPSPTAPERAITVVGEGQIREAPDLAKTTLGVEATAPSAVAATRDAAKRMAAVIAAVKRLGVADVDIQTSAFSIRSERNNLPPAKPGAAAGTTPLTYSASNSVAVTIRDTSRTGAILDAAVNAGANEVWGVSFAHSDEAALRRRARELAVADARARAEGLARAAGVVLGPVISIEEVGLQPFGRAMGQAGVATRAAEVTPIERGELTVTDRIQIVFALEPAG
jgi:uncharacterized protein YggE